MGHTKEKVSLGRMVDLIHRYIDIGTSLLMKQQQWWTKPIN